MRNRTIAATRPPMASSIRLGKALARGIAPLAAISFTLATLLAFPAAGQAGPEEVFKKLAGSWHGAGQLVLSDGSKERISCRGYYTLKSGGGALTIAIRCNSPNYNIEMRSLLNSSGGGVAGDWEERTFNATGAVSGSAGGDRIALAISGAITGSMSIAVGGASHKVNITASGVGFKSVSMTLSRG
jgi:hypothetical protein